MSGVDTETGFLSCYQCAKCTSGCPVADRMDLKPHQVMRLLQLGETEELLAAGGPWQCVGCETCTARCPNDVDISVALAQIREEALKRGIVAGAGNKPFFDDLFLGMIKRRGRVNDGMLVMRYKLHAGGMLKDWRLGLKMFKAGKLKLRTPSVARMNEVAGLFEQEDAE